MTDEKTDGPTRVEKRLDEEYSAEHGNTLAGSSIEEEEHPELHPRSPGELATKMKAEAAEGDGIVDKAKRVLREVDRDVSGEYERREDDTAPPAGPRTD